MRRIVLMGLLLVALVVLGMPASYAQGPSFAEGFDDVGPTNPGEDGPANLIARGWIFRNQSAPRGSSSWYGTEGGQVLDPHSGTGFMGADYDSTEVGPNASISNWAIVPAVAGQQAGTPLSFAVAGSYAGRDDRLQVLYSPSGGTSTGAGASAVGDFTQVLLDINPVPTNGWQEHTLALPGPGRVAFRYYLPAPTGPGTPWANFFGIDTLVIGTPPAGPIPIPQAGQTVTWGPELSPIDITGRLIIPAGGTVNVEPGVEIHLNYESTLVIRGTVQGTGTASAPIRVTAASNYPPALEVHGTLALTHAEVGGQVRPDDGSTIRFDQTLFRDNGVFFADGWYFKSIPLLQIERSHFEGPGAHINIAHFNVVMRDTTFHNASVNLLYTHLFLDNLTFDGGYLSVGNDSQPDYINNITIRNSPTAAIQLGGGNSGNDYFLGPDLVLENNEYPVGVTDGGLLPGSFVPATGNTHNAVRGPGDGDFRGPVTWSDVGVPYQVPGYAYLFGRWRFLPGTTFQFAPGAGFESREAVQARGRPDAPVTFERLDPAQPWYRLATMERLEHAVVDGSQYGLVFDALGIPNYVDSTLFRNNGYSTVGASVIRGSQFLGNEVGLRNGEADANGATNPNSFVGNTLAAEGARDAAHNWWGSPTGPTTSANPGGTGDPIEADVPFQPFRTAAPDYSDSPPLVTLNEPSFLLEAGSKVMLMWQGEDDGAITGYRILFSPAGVGPNLYTVVAELPPTQHAYQWTVPDIGFQVTGELASIRVEATDNRGQIGWDAQAVGIPSGRVEGTLTMTPSPSGSYHAGREAFEVCWTASGLNDAVSGVEAYLFFDADRSFGSLGGVTTYLNCLPLPLMMPLIHTEDARLALKLHGGLNDEKWFFSEPFTIYADPRVGDAGPAITLLSPQAGQVFVPGQPISITWEASDDEALRSFEVQASFDNGRTWHLVAADLPATARSYSWVTAPNTNLDAVRVRVVVKDLRFQNASDGADRTFAIRPGSGGATPTPSATPSAPSATPTATAVPPSTTRTPTGVPPSATATATGAPPTVTRTPTSLPPTVTRTPTSVPPGATATAVAPTVTRTPTSLPPTVTPAATAGPSNQQIFLPLLGR